jgi:predicted Zn-dependent protease
VFRGSRFLHPGLALALDFPEGWQTQNSADAVGAVSPQRDALVVLQTQGAPGDPRAAAEKFAQANGLALQNAASGSQDGMPKFHALLARQTQEGPIVYDFTWIAHPRVMLRLTGMSPQARYASQARVFGEVARSISKLSASERDGIRDRRLSLVEVRPGETLAALSSRTHNVWSEDETAIANALPREPRLTPGQLVKIAVEVPYRP